MRQISNTGHDSNKCKLHALINTEQIKFNNSCNPGDGTDQRVQSLMLMMMMIKFNDACHHSVQNLSSSTLLYRNIKTEEYRSIILPLVFMGVKLVL
jgi:hypothetical protein